MYAQQTVTVAFTTEYEQSTAGMHKVSTVQPQLHW